MDYRRFDDTIVLRMDPDEEILMTLEAVCDREGVELAEVAALGALKRFTVCLFDTSTHEFHENTFEFPAEITGLWGTVTTMDGAFYPHIHMSAADAKARVYGGHLKSAVVSATAEMTIRVLNGRVERRFNPEIGLNLMEFGRE